MDVRPTGNIISMPSDNDKRMIQAQQRLADTLVQGGLARTAIVNESSMKVTIDWTADGLRFRDAVLRAYDSVAERELDNALREFCRMIAFIIEVR